MNKHPSPFVWAYLKEEERERRSSRVISKEHDPRVGEVIGKVPQHERGDLP